MADSIMDWRPEGWKNPHRYDLLEEPTEEVLIEKGLHFAYEAGASAMLEAIWGKPWLGNATTAELIDELRARCKVNGTLNYKTVQDEGAE
jgi:hypothetical protein